MSCIRGQPPTIMKFPNIYFKLHSTEYAQMPYTVESCLKFFANGINNKGTLYITVWRDTAEMPQLNNRRIKQFKHDLGKYICVDKLNIEIASVSWQSFYEQVKKKPQYEPWLKALGSMIEILLVDYDPPRGSALHPKTKQKKADIKRKKVERSSGQKSTYSGSK